MEWKNSMIERPVRAVVKLMNVEDTSLLEDMRKVQELVKEIIAKKTGNIEKEIPDDHIDSTENTKDLSDADGSEADDAMKVPEVFEKSKPPEVFEKSKPPEVFEKLYSCTHLTSAANFCTYPERNLLDCLFGEIYPREGVMHLE